MRITPARDLVKIIAWGISCRALHAIVCARFSASAERSVANESHAHALNPSVPFNQNAQAIVGDVGGGVGVGVGVGYRMQCRSNLQRLYVLADTLAELPEKGFSCKFSGNTRLISLSHQIKIMVSIMRCEQEFDSEPLMKCLPKATARRHRTLAGLPEMTMCLIGVFAFCLVAPRASADETNRLGRLVFHDEFDRSETQEDSDEVGNGWKTDNDKPWSLGKKQADLRGGALHVTPSNGKESKLLVIRPCDFRDGTIEFRFQLKNDNDVIGIVVADRNLKDVHAGHVLSVRAQKAKLMVSDMLSGAFDPEIWARKKANKQTEADQKQVEACRKNARADIRIGVWHKFSVTTRGKRLTVHLDEAEVVDFSSPGFANPKTILRLSIKRFGAIDDFKLYVAD